MSERPQTVSSLLEFVNSASVESDMTAEPSGATSPRLSIPVTESISDFPQITLLETSGTGETGSPTTVPYQTSTLTSIVTVVVEGATERKRVPITKLKQTLADHDLLANSVNGYNQELLDKSSEFSSEKAPQKYSDKSGERNQSRPVGSYRGRPRRPLIIEPSTTKSLPLYLQRRRATTELPQREYSEATEDSRSTSKTRGGFTPSKTREKSRIRPSSTEPTLANNDFTNPRTNRYRIARPSLDSSRVTASRSRPSNFFASTELNQDDSLISKDGGKKVKLSQSSLEDGIRTRSFGDGDSEKLELDKPTGQLSQGRTRTTTDKSLSFLQNITSTQTTNNSRSSFFGNRGRKRTSDTTIKRTRPITSLSEGSNKVEAIPTNTERSRFHIQRKRKPLKRTDTSQINDYSLTNNLNTTQDANKIRDGLISIKEGNPENITKEEHEIMISQKISSNKPDNNSTTPSYLFVGKLHINASIEKNKTFENISTYINNSSNIINSTPPNQTTINMLQHKATNIYPEQINTNLKAFNNESTTTVYFVNEPFKLESTTNPYINLTSVVEHDPVEDGQRDEDLNVIASHYSEQSFTGGRGTIRFQEISKIQDERQRSPITNSNNISSLQSKKRKIAQSHDKMVLSNDPHKPSKRRKVLVKKSKVTPTPDVPIFKNNSDPQKIYSSNQLQTNNNKSKNITSVGNYTLEIDQNIFNGEPRLKNLTNRKRTNFDNKESSTQFNDLLIQENLAQRGRKLNSGIKKFKVLKSRKQVNNPNDQIISDVHQKNKRVVVRKRPMSKAENNIFFKVTESMKKEGTNRHSEKGLSDLDTGTSLYVPKETKSNVEPKEIFLKPVQETQTNLMRKTLKSRGKIKAKNSLMNDLVGVMGEDEAPTIKPEVGR